MYHKPVPESADTIRFAPPTRLQRWSMNAVLSALKRLRHGCIMMTLPNRNRMVFGDSDSQPPVNVTVRRYDFFQRLATAGDTGLGESYMAGDWQCDDIPGFLALLARNWDVLGNRSRWASMLARGLDYLGHMRKPNTVTGSRRNIHRHYDLSNDFFRLFLDPSMTYSCGLYRNPDDTLAAAQKNKLRAIIQKADIQPEHHVLEVGCGWGSFAIEAVRQTGCRVTGITVSDEQFSLATQRVREAGLDDRITIEKRDYRHLDLRFDRIVSIEMLEAVGHAYLSTFFKAIRSALKADGRVVIQVITMPDQRYDQYRKRSDWIKKHIFPGGHLPSLSAMCSAAADASDLIVDQAENIGDHYAPTLHQWCQNLLSRVDDVKELGFDDVFIRKWQYYFSYCEAGFATRMLNDLQLVMRPAGPC